MIVIVTPAVTALGDPSVPFCWMPEIPFSPPPGTETSSTQLFLGGLGAVLSIMLTHAAFHHFFFSHFESEKTLFPFKETCRLISNKIPHSGRLRGLENSDHSIRLAFSTFRRAPVKQKDFSFSTSPPRSRLFFIPQNRFSSLLPWAP